MNCTRCGGAEAVVKRDAAFYCGKCALARDWEEVIALVQEERVMVGRASGPTVDFGAAEAPKPAAPAAPAAVPEAAADDPAPDPEPAPAASAGADLPADPFA